MTSSPVTGASRRTLLLHGFLQPPFRGPMLAAILGLIASSAIDFRTSLPLFCGAMADAKWITGVKANLSFILAVNPPLNLALSWITMVAAMMTPLIALPLAYVRTSSLSTRRERSAVCFLLGYFAVWGMAGLPLLAAALTLRLITGGATAVLLTAIAVALVWAASPLQIQAQNRAHRLQRIGLFGFAADRDCFCAGVILGCWCLASCWAWMLIPLFIARGHGVAMAAVGIIVLAERLRGPERAIWRIPVILSRPVDWLQSLFRYRWRGSDGYV